VSPGGLFDRTAIQAALIEVAREVEAAGLDIEFLVVGSAAIALQFDRPALTGDLDALYPMAKREEVARIAAVVAERHGWDPSWLNDDALMFQSHYDSAVRCIVFASTGGVTIRLAPADLLLAMRLLAARGDATATTSTSCSMPAGSTRSPRPSPSSGGTTPTRCSSRN